MKKFNEWLPIIGAIIIALIMIVAVLLSVFNTNVIISLILVGIASLLAYVLFAYVVSKDKSRTIVERGLLIVTMSTIFICIIVLLIMIRTPYSGRFH